ncbi:MAG: class II aldolase/adducin family protein [Chitinophagales bacterium]|nr:class II aldolase/adducin family protein [Chitinophagales bacterium]
MDIQEARKIVCDAGKQLVKDGLIARTWGNVSIRLDDKRMVITPSGRKYQELEPEDMVIVNFYTLDYEGLKPSSELKLHCEIYKTRPHIQAVIHTHQLFASVVAATQKDVQVLDTKHQEILGAKVIKAAPYALPNSKAITLGTVEAVGKSNAALMANHGVLCIGEDMQHTFEVAHTLEAACKLFIESQQKTA